LLEAMMATAAPPDVLADLADRIEAAAARLDAQPRGRTYEGFAEPANAGDVHGFFEFSPLSGMANPLAPPITMEVVDDTVVGRAVFDTVYEGPPGHVHGGYVAAAFDEVLGLVQSLSGAPGMTATLTVRYRRPTPLYQQLVFVGRLARVEGRKVFTTATLHAGETLCAESEGLFISIDPARFQQMAAERDASAT